ncbi:hypothetical protein [Roseimarinus sediminis]|uniref:hypothetical protein n=1 Tax=Roseimarinus sediminis TaxID=1610899 RepID=UPI003D20437B
MNRAGRLLLVLLLISAAFLPTRAQNTGALPYLDSEHAYQLKIGEAGNDRKWVITDKAATDPITYTIWKADFADDGLDWFEVTDQAMADDGLETIEILFDRSVFAPGETLIPSWYLQYYEYDETNACISAREFVLTVGENEFYLTVGADDAQCNDRSGLVHTYAQVDNDPVGTDLYATEVTYTVTMHKEGDYDPDSWRFDASFFEDITLSNSITPTAFAATVSTVDGGSASFAGSGPYTVTVIPPPSADFPDEVEVTLTVSFENPVLADVTPTLTVSNGSATKNGTPPAVTYDNEDIYPYDPVDPLLVPGDREQVVTIRAIPATDDIEPGLGETVASAGNPLQNSTHRYQVLMEDAASNRLNALTGWHLTRTGGTDEIAEDAATYTLTPTYDDATNTAAASIRFNFTYDDEVPANNEYTIYFTEQNSKDCSSVRAYPITIGAPFDVDIAAVDDDCSYADGKVYETYTGEETQIVYTVNLNNAAYDATWQFDLELLCAELGDELTVLSDVAKLFVSGGTMGTPESDAGKYTIPVTISKSGEDPVGKSVTVTVTYSGLYETAHNITANLVVPTEEGSFGSYSETDADDGIVLSDAGAVEGAINQAAHVIQAMPQPGVLAGVD